jgi:uncharacterized protein
MPFRILSIDGGGLRGLLPLLILEEIEAKTGKPIADSFDLISGTSTGGIIACAITLRDPSTKKLKFSLQQVRSFYEKYGSTIFYDKAINVGNLLYPKYYSHYFEAVLKHFFDSFRLQDCQTPLLIPSFKIDDFSPFYFTSRYVTPGSAENDAGKNFTLIDICRSTAAAPTYFSSHYIEYLEQNAHAKSCNLIDGGVFVNNPALAALAEVLNHGNDVLYKRDKTEDIKIDDIYLMSLGTGLSTQSITRSQGQKWGKVQWAPRLIEIMMQGNSVSVHEQIKVLLKKEQYLRLNVHLPDSLTRMDDSSLNTQQGLNKLFLSGIRNNAIQIAAIEKFINAAGI